MAKPRLYLLIGFPGSGKTTVAQIINQATGAEHLWADKQRLDLFDTPTHTEAESLKLYNQMNKRAAKLLRRGQNVIFDTNFSFKRDRDHLRRIAQESGADSLIIWLTTPRELAKERATMQNNSHPTRVLGAMSPDDFDRIANHQQPPTKSEKFIKIDGTNVDRQKLLELIK